jgi:hypothetical protein
MTIGAHFVINVQISISITDNKYAIALRHPCNTSTSAAIRASSKVKFELVTNSHILQTIYGFSLPKPARE